MLLTDGANTRGPLPVDAARQAANRDVRVCTIGFGTTEFSQMVSTPERIGSDIFSGRFTGGGFRGGLGGGRFAQYLLLDEATLRSVAETTGGAYFRAENADQLLEVFRELPKRVEVQSEIVEISAAFAGLGALFVLTALVLSMKWKWNRIG